MSRTDERAGGRAGPDEPGEMLSFFLKAKGRRAIFEIQQKVGRDGRAGGQGQTSQTK